MSFINTPPGFDPAKNPAGGPTPSGQTDQSNTSPSNNARYSPRFPGPRGTFNARWKEEHNAIRTIIRHHQEVLQGTKDKSSLKLASGLCLFNQATGNLHPLFEAQCIHLDPLLKNIDASDRLFMSMVQVSALLQFCTKPAPIDQEPSIPHIILQKDYTDNKNLILLSKNQGTPTLLKIPFKPKEALETLGKFCIDDSGPGCSVIASLSAALVPSDWRFEAPSTISVDMIENGRITIEALFSTARRLLYHADAKIATLGSRLITLGLCHSNESNGDSRRYNLIALFMRMTDILGAAQSKEERLSHLVNLETALRHSGIQDFPSDQLFSSINRLVEQDFFPKEDFSKEIAKWIWSSCHTSLNDVPAEFLEATENPKSDPVQLCGYINLALNSGGLPFSTLLHFLKTIETNRCISSEQKLELLLKIGLKMKAVPLDLEETLNLYRYSTALLCCLEQKAPPHDRQSFREVLYWIMPLLAQNSHMLGLSDAFELMEALADGQYLKTEDLADAALAVDLCQTLLRNSLGKEALVAKLWKRVFPNKHAYCFNKEKHRNFIYSLVEKLYKSATAEDLILGDELLDNLESFFDPLRSYQSAASLRNIKLKRLAADLHAIDEIELMEKLTLELPPASQGGESLDEFTLQFKKPGVKIEASKIAELIKFIRSASTDEEKILCRRLVRYAANWTTEKPDLKACPSETVNLLKFLLREETLTLFKSDERTFEELLINALEVFIKLDIKDKQNNCADIYDALSSILLSKAPFQLSPAFTSALAASLLRLQNSLAHGYGKLPKTLLKTAKHLFPKLLHCLAEKKLAAEMLPIFGECLTMPHQTENRSHELEGLLFGCVETLLSSSANCTAENVRAIDKILSLGHANKIINADGLSNAHYTLFEKLFHALLNHGCFDLLNPWLDRLEKFDAFKAPCNKTLNNLKNASEMYLDCENAENLFSLIQHPSIMAWGNSLQLQDVLLCLLKHYAAQGNHQRCAELLTGCRSLIMDAHVLAEAGVQAKTLLKTIIPEIATAHKVEATRAARPSRPGPGRDGLVTQPQLYEQSPEVSLKPAKKNNSLSLALALLVTYSPIEASLWAQLFDKVAVMRGNEQKRDVCLAFVQAAHSIAVDEQSYDHLVRVWSLVIDILTSLKSDEVCRLIEANSPMHSHFKKNSLTDLEVAIYAKSIRAAANAALLKEDASRLHAIESIAELWNKTQPRIQFKDYKAWSTICLPVLNLCVKIPGEAFVKLQCEMIQLRIAFETTGLSGHVERLLFEESRSSILSSADKESLLGMAESAARIGLKGLDFLVCAEALLKFDTQERHRLSAAMFLAKFTSDERSATTSGLQVTKLLKQRAKQLLDTLAASKIPSVLGILKTSLPLLKKQGWLEGHAMRESCYRILSEIMSNSNSDREVQEALEIFCTCFEISSQVGEAGLKCLGEVIVRLPYTLLELELVELYVRADKKIARALDTLLKEDPLCSDLLLKYIDYLNILLDEHRNSFEDADRLEDIRPVIYAALLRHGSILANGQNLPIEPIADFITDLTLCIPPSPQGVPRDHCKIMLQLLGDCRTEVFNSFGYRYNALVFYLVHEAFERRKLSPKDEAKGLMFIIPKLCEEGTNEHWERALAMLQTSLMPLAGSCQGELLSCYKHLLEESVRTENSVNFVQLTANLLESLPILLQANRNLAVNLCMAFTICIINICLSKNDKTDKNRFKLLDITASFIYAAFNLGVFDLSEKSFLEIIKRLVKASKEHRFQEELSAARWIPSLLAAKRTAFQQSPALSAERVLLLKEWLECLQTAKAFSNVQAVPKGQLPPNPASGLTAPLSPDFEIILKACSKDHE